MTDMSSANTSKIRVSYFKTTFKNNQEAIPGSVLIGCCGGREEGKKGFDLLLRGKGLGWFWRSITCNEI